MTDLTDVYYHTANGITARLVEEISDAFNDNQELESACQHLIYAGGKRVRAVIAVAVCGALGGGNPKMAIDLGVVMELVHTFTLIHDDIMDGSLFRRGVESVHKRFGVPTAINAGNALFTLALENLARVHIPDSTVRACSRRVLDACINLTIGQQLDFSLQQSGKQSWREYQRVNRLKTAPLFSAAAALGAIASNGNPAEIRYAEEWGTCFGISFQVRDDALDKDPPPLIYMPHSLEEEADLWKQAALGALVKFPEGEWRDLLEDMTNWQVTRSE